MKGDNHVMTPIPAQLTGDAVGIASAVAAGPVVTAVVSGELSGFVGLTIGANYLVGTTVGTIVREDDTGAGNYPGSIGEFKKIIGRATSATTLLVEPKNQLAL